MRTPPESRLHADSMTFPRHQRLINRRSLLRSAAGLGAFPLVTGLLAACGGSASTATNSAKSATSAAASTATAATTPSATTAPASSPTTGSPASTTNVAASPTSSSTQAVATPASTTKFVLEPAKHTGGKIIEGSSVDMDSANPIISKETQRAGSFALIFESLVQPNPSSGAPMPLLARAWEISEDGLTYTFTLNSGITWQDGKPFTAKDVKFTIDLITNNATNSIRYSDWHGTLAGLQIPDDGHVVIKLAKPTATFLGNQGQQGIIPQHILNGVAPKAIAQHPFSLGKKGVTIGTGPFTFDEWVKDDHITLARYSKYWQGAPYLDQWLLKVVSSQAVADQQLKTGELDIGTIEAASYASMKNEPSLNVVAYDSGRATWYGYNLDAAKSKLFQDPRVRQALFMALDRNKMVSAIEFGLATIAVGTIAPISWAYDPGAITPTYRYDPDGAKRLLAEAGYTAGPDGVLAKDGQKLAFDLYTYSGLSLLESYMAVLQEEWKKIGVAATPKFEDANAFITRVSSTHDFDVFLFNNGFGDIDPDQSTWWDCKASLNLVGYCNPAADKLMTQGLATTDIAKRKALYGQFEDIFMQDLPAGFICWEKLVEGVNKRVHNYFPNYENERFDAHKWWVDG